MALTANECKFGWYGGYLADGNSTSGSLNAQMGAIETLIQGPIQVVILGGGTSPTTPWSASTGTSSSGSG
jgi:hypothetical protein